MVIGTDLDGVLTKIGLYNTNTKLPWWCGLWLIFVPANKRMIKSLGGRSIIIISARPKQLESITRLWLKIHRVSFTSLVLVGPGKNMAEKKLAAIKEFGIDIYIDDDIRTVIFLEDAGVNAFHCKGASCRR